MQSSLLSSKLGLLQPDIYRGKKFIRDSRKNQMKWFRQLNVKTYIHKSVFQSCMNRMANKIPCIF